MQLEYSEFGLGRLAVFNPVRIEVQIRNSKSRATSIFDIAKELLSNGNDLVKEARIGLETGCPFQTLKRLSRLKGWVSNFGGTRTCEIIEEIELLLKEHSEHPALPSMFDILALEFSRFLHATQQWLADQEARLMAFHNHPSVDERLDKLLNQLQQARLDALQTYDELRPEFIASLDPERLHELEETLKQLDYPQALEILRSIERLREPSGQDTHTSEREGEL